MVSFVISRLCPGCVMIWYRTEEGLGSGGLFYSVVATRRQPNSLYLREVRPQGEVFEILRKVSCVVEQAGGSCNPRFYQALGCLNGLLFYVDSTVTKMDVRWSQVLVRVEPRASKRCLG